MKILVTGGNGQVGWELAQKNSANFQVIALPRSQLDILNNDQIITAITHWQPDIVVNTAAYTAVDKAEQEQEQAFKINRDGPSILTNACAQANLPLLHISTDYVFAGNQSHPYREDEAVGPLNIYGASKLAGEIAVRKQWNKHIILRTSGVFSSHGHNFVKTMLRVAQTKETLSVVNDQITCPTPAADIASTILILCEKLLKSVNPQWGTYHYCSNEPVSWYQLTEAILALARQHYSLTVQQLRAISSAEYTAPARRPAYSALDCTKIKTIFGIQVRSWRDELARIITLPV